MLITSRRMNALDYQMTKSQRHALAKFLKTIEFDERPLERLSRDELISQVLCSIVNNGGYKQFTYAVSDADNWDERFAVYRRYQVAIHHDHPDALGVQQFRRFLADNPFTDKTQTETRLGTLQTEFRLDGRLIAVGVLDLLPSCLSSVYFY